ncbi:MAG: glycosyltransferase family 2 protein [Pyrinomonadaceae bacterium]
MDTPLVSVIIPNYNYGRYLAEAVESALNQTFPPHEVIVVDDGSTDNSLEVLAEYDGRIKVISQNNQGVGAARNAGARMATGNLLAFLDADDYWAPEKLEKQVSKFSEDPDMGLVHCGLACVDENGDRTSERDIVDGEQGWVADILLRVEPVIVGPGSNSLIRREVFVSVGGYDTNPNLHPSEDWELSYRVACVYKFGFVAEPLLYYRQHGGGGHTNIGRMERAMLIGFEKAFANGAAVDPRECYGKLYQVLAGSYFRAGQYRGFIRNAAKSVWARPAGLRYFLEFPVRRLKDKAAKK